ncbi:MAG: amidohydrolase family protein, partial [Gemmataceae bacterium]|nr:amidohydrolase family protein [Gemmataceae bacterium]
AHPREHVRPPDLDAFLRLQDAAGGLIRLVTLAPEWPGAPAFIGELARRGLVVALGHTAASADAIRRAVDAGARLSTHLGNGCAAMLPRHDNPLWAQLAEDRLLASVIADGHHLPADVLECVLRCKTPARTILTCDASSLAGMPPGLYPMWGKQIEVRPGGRVGVPGTPYLAGSGVFLDACVAHLASLGWSLPDCLDMASAHPRALLGLPGGSLETGQPADLVLFHEAPFRVVGTVAG